MAPLRGVVGTLALLVRPFARAAPARADPLPSHQAFAAGVSAHEGCAAHTDEFFPFLPDHVKYDPASTDPFTFRYYNKTEVIAGKTMAEWLRFSIAFWHTFRGDGSDPFGAPTKVRGAREAARSPGLRGSPGLVGAHATSAALLRRRAGRGRRRR